MPALFLIQTLKYMKVKLLKKIRNKGRNVITIYSTTTETTFRGSYCTGMSYGFTGDEYKGLFSFGDTEEQVKEKAMNIYIKKEIEYIRKRYKNYSRKYKLGLFS